MAADNPDLENIEVLNRELVERIVDAPEGSLSKVASAASNMIRRKIRENGFTRSIIPPKTVGDSDFDRSVDSELPVIIEDMEPLSAGAKVIPFNDGPNTQFYRGDKFVVKFSKLTTPEFTKNVDELRTYKMDLRAVITDNALKDIQRAEDASFIAGINELVGPSNGVGAAGFQQNFVFAGGITRDNYVKALSVLENRDLNNGVFLMNRTTAKEFLKFDRSEIGGDLSERMFQDGLTALQQAKIFGVRHIFTIKRDLVPDGVIYCFTEPDFLGRFYVLQDVTMYVEKKKDILRFSAMEKLGIAIANVAGVARVSFNG